MTDQQRFKSPPYPYLDIEAAVEKATRLADVAKGFAVPLTSVAKAWGYSPTSSSTIKVLGALNQYGLILDEGSGEARKYKLSKNGELIVRDKRPNSREREDALRQAALAPKVFADLWERFRSAEVDVDTIVHELTLGRKHSGRAEYSESAAQEIAVRFAASLAFAGIRENVESGEEGKDQEIPQVENTRPAPRVGDLVQWTSSGVDQFASPARVVGLSDDQKWAWTDQGGAAVPSEELSVLQGRQESSQGLAPLPPLHVAEMLVRGNRRADVFEEKKALDEGEAVLVWPRHLSEASVEDMEYWLNGVLRQIRRRASQQQ